MNVNKHTQSNVVIDAIGYLAFWVLVSTGIMMKYILLPGSRRGAGSPTSLMGLDRHDWGNVHFWASVIFVVTVLIHIVLHWSWITGMFKKFLSVRSWRVVVPALVFPVAIAFLPLMGIRGFDASEESGGKNRAGYSTSRNVGAPADHTPKTTEQSGLFALGTEGEGNEINGFKIRGRTTLQEIEEGTGVKADQLLAALNLPRDLAKNERLSLLMGKYGFEMNRLREAVKQLGAMK